MRGSIGLRAVALAVAALAAIGCDATPRPSGSIPTLPTTAPTAPSAADCGARIAAVDLSKEATILAVDSCRFTPMGRDAAQAALSGGASGGALWAAVWVYAASGTDPAPLRPVLLSKDTSARALAAAALIGFGDASGFEPIRVALGDITNLAGSEPPMTIAAFAVATLQGTIVADGLPTESQGWVTWLAANASRLTFDTPAGAWSLP